MDPAHVKAIARGFVWFEELIDGRARSVREIAKREGLTDRYVSHLINHTLSFAEASIQAETVR
jgi:hypothetical protein